MNYGLMLKTIREAWLTTLLFGIGFMAVEALLWYVLPSFYDQVFGSVAQVPFVRNVVQALLGTDIGPDIGPKMLGAVAWVHPVALSLLWAQEISFFTRSPAGEIDRGTIDVLLGLPVSRQAVYLNESLVGLASGAFVILMGLLGGLLSAQAVRPEFRHNLGRVWIVVINLFCLYISVGGLAMLASAMSNRRGRAMGCVFGIVLASYLLNFLAQIWQPAKSLSFLCILTYYQPLEALRDGNWPWGNMLVLTIGGGVLWIVGGTIFSRRQICTV